MASWDDVRRITLALPETDEQTSHGNRTWRVREKGFVWERPLRRGDLEALGAGAPAGPILGVRVEHLVAKEAWLAAEPDVVFTTPHFNGYPAVLVQLALIDEARLAALIEEAWLARAPTRVARAYLARRPSGSEHQAG
jgi:hypothetical protein